jgi:acetyltransferase-like isoleucine patch superfamily enzyme
MSQNTVTVDGADNQVEIGQNVQLAGVIIGNRNKVRVLTGHRSVMRIHINGDDNVIDVATGSSIDGLFVSCGNHERANKTLLQIGKNFSIEHGGRVYLYNSRSRCNIGENCLFSREIIIRCGESPHLLFDGASGRYLDVSDGVYVGDHVWVGEQAYITKRARIASESIVAARAVVTRSFSVEHSVLAGNPANVVRSGVQWIRNRHHLEQGSLYHASYTEHLLALERDEE